MDMLEAIRARHAVREYTDKPLEPEIISQLEEAIAAANEEGSTSLQLVVDDSAAFSKILARYGVFTNVKNYIAVVAKKGAEGEIAAGYYGQKIVLFAQQLGLNTCWVGGTYNKRRTHAKICSGEKLYLVIAIGYGETQGKPSKTKSIQDLSEVRGGETPEWFTAAIEAVQLAPTGMNQQRFFFTLEEGVVTPRIYTGFYTNIDFGIAKRHFEIGAAAAGATENDWHWSSEILR